MKTPGVVATFKTMYIEDREEIEYCAYINDLIRKISTIKGKPSVSPNFYGTSYVYQEDGLRCTYKDSDYGNDHYHFEVHVSRLEDIQKVYSAAREKLQQQEKTSSKAQKPVETANSILDELDSIIGLDEVKRDVHMLTSFIRVNNLRRTRGLKAPVMSKHLVLPGNPGTGKTTVARMIARIYHLIGAIKKNKIVETSRAGLVAGYVGQTAIKTQEVYECRSEDFGNARSVRKLFERIIAHQAERIVALNEIKDETLVELTLSNVENAIQTAV